MEKIRGENLQALVDMGSNGIRFSISDLSPGTSRILPTVYQDRAGISLYDAQYSLEVKIPIPREVIEQVTRSFLEFKSTCEDFDVPQSNIRVVATEATREAINSVEFRAAIQRATGWEVKMLAKEDEGRIGAMGIASSFSDIDGLVLDLGGGSVQMSWISTTSAGDVEVRKSISLPYGAAALRRRLEEAGNSEEKRNVFESEVREALAAAFKDVAPPADDPSRHDKTRGIPVFLSGGGFRGWGHLLMDSHPISPYPIPIINGFSVLPNFFNDTRSVQAHISSVSEDDTKIFRISARRQTQAPAIALLIRALVSAVPVEIVRFAQGGVREGVLFSSLPPSVRALKPLLVATQGYSRQYCTPSDTARIVDLLTSAIPPHSGLCPESIRPLLAPFVNLLYVHQHLPKEARAAAGLRSTTTGVLAGVHGLTHAERAGLALLLCHRWGSEVAPTDDDILARMERVAGCEIAWWCLYLGRVGALVGAVYPAGAVRKERVSVEARMGPKGVQLKVRWRAGTQGYEDYLRGVEKAGKKKNWIGGRDGWGLKVEVEVEEDGDALQS